MFYLRWAFQKKLNFCLKKLWNCHKFPSLVFYIRECCHDPKLITLSIFSLTPFLISLKTTIYLSKHPVVQFITAENIFLKKVSIRKSINIHCFILFLLLNAILNDMICALTKDKQPKMHLPPHILIVHDKNVNQIYQYICKSKL